MKKYALIKDNKIVKFRNISDNDDIILTKLIKHNYLPVIEQDAPKFDYITQSLTDTYVVNKDNVIRTWTVVEKEFFEAQQYKKSIIEQQTLDKIKSIFDGSNSKIEIDKAVTDKDSDDVLIAAVKNNIELRALTSTIEKGEIK